jgi:hypothetical protein
VSVDVSRPHTLWHPHQARPLAPAPARTGRGGRGP